jgi:hypothetical protein
MGVQYNSVSQQPYQHFTAIHSIRFVDPTTRYPRYKGTYPVNWKAILGNRNQLDTCYSLTPTYVSSHVDKDINRKIISNGYFMILWNFGLNAKDTVLQGAI